MAQDLDNQLTAVHLAPATKVAVGSGTQTYAGVDIRDYVGIIKAVISHESDHNLATNNVVYSIQDSADNSTFAANTDVTPLTTTASLVLGTLSIDTRKCKRYIQAKIVNTGTTQTVDFSMVGVGLKQVV